jgi:hypothetical protein
MKLTDDQIDNIKRLQDRICGSFMKFNGYQKIETECALPEMIHIKWLANTMEEYNRQYWEIIMIMALYNLGNTIEGSIRDVKQYANNKNGYYIASCLSYEGYDFDMIQDCYK